MTNEAMHRRSCLTLLGTSAAAWPMAARAQQSAMPVVGYLSPRDRQAEEENLPFVRKGMSDHGFIEERNFVFDFRFAYGHYDLIPVFAEELVRRRVLARDPWSVCQMVAWCSPSLASGCNRRRDVPRSTSAWSSIQPAQ